MTFQTEATRNFGSQAASGFNRWFLADMFGAENVGAVHGVLLTAWSAAAIVGPVTITELSDRAKANRAPGMSRIHIYDQPLEVLAAMLAVGFILTTLVRPVAGLPQRSLPVR